MKGIPNNGLTGTWGTLMPLQAASLPWKPKESQEEGAKVEGRWTVHWEGRGGGGWKLMKNGTQRGVGDTH